MSNEVVDLHGPVRRWHVLAGLVEKYNLQTMVEVGCREGKITAFLAEHCPALVITAIDTSPEADQARAWGKACLGFSDRVSLMRMGSAEAAQKFSNGSIGMICLEACDTETATAADIDAWFHVVQEGGVLCGHDYNDKHIPVMRAVASRFNLMDVAIGPDSVWIVQKGVAQ